MNLFAYGSLREGGGLTHMLGDAAATRYPARLHGWTLYEFAGGGYPVALPGGNGWVYGDLYAIAHESAEWQAIERMERGAGYHLTPVTVRTHRGLAVVAFTFGWFDPDDDWIGPEVFSGDWIAHLAAREEAANYRDARL